ncbi:DUF6090 family protein [Winogradskyella flava]|uniref:Uncharacterized protein n=1 Tax=Winogradskyella flava TaxID=1884876 RepID=A0A842ITM4_9FLAO|nr:DUF6090 family protein [Winogradskyella flava]MBC2846390.1 hypothetical protein [Winogradskyella flava]
MIKFFRRVRQRLLTENKFSKYLIYAIGEIILVVIGILIALQVSNFNEQRKQQEQAFQLKKALQTELKADIELIKLDLEYIEKELKINNSFAQRLSTASATEDTLIQIVRHEYRTGFNGARTLDKTTFNSLESTGKINLLSNEIASRVQKYYRDRDLIISDNKINLQIYFNLVEPFLLKYPNDSFSITGPLQDTYWKNADVNTLNSMFNGLLTMRLFTLNVRKGRLNKSLEVTQNLINQLD